MRLETVNKNIKRLIEWRRTASFEEQKKINLQLDKLYDFKWEILKGAQNV